MQALEIFERAFADEHGSRYRAGAHPAAFLDVWTFLQCVEPRGFLAAHDDGRVVGYAIFISSLKRVQFQALVRGALFRWIIAGLRGRFGIRWSAVPRILANKLMFIRSGRRYRSSGDAQLLNIAVDPSAQGRGAATALVRAGLQFLRARGVPEVRLEVRPWNAGALRVYRKTGWREAGRTRDLEGEWIVMVANPSVPA